MEKLEQIRTELLKAHKEICGAVEIGKCKSFNYNRVSFYIDAIHYDCGSNGNHLEVWRFSTGNTKIEISGDISEALKLAKVMKDWQKIVEFIKSENI